MGGKLFNLGRLDRADYLELEAEVRRYLDKKFPGQYLIPRYYGDKPDFGDMDIVLTADAVTGDWGEFRMQIIADLGVTDYRLKSHLLSMAYRNFQVDIFKVPPQHFHSTWQFLCYNDLGNLLGKLFRRFNLKYGEKGLFYVFRRADGHYKKDLFLTRDMKKILGFLELDHAEWDAGFANLEEMFAWVVNCKYFTVRPFLKRSATTEKRLRERTTMQRFIDYLEAGNIDKAYPFAEDRDEYIPMIAACFPEADLLTGIAEEKERERLVEIIRAKYNGRIVMEMFPELKGKALGRFMETFKLTFEQFDQEIAALPADQIRECLIRHHQSAWQEET